MKTSRLGGKRQTHAGDDESYAAESFRYCLIAARASDRVILPVFGDWSTVRLRLLGGPAIAFVVRFTPPARLLVFRALSRVLFFMAEI